MQAERRLSRRNSDDQLAWPADLAFAGGRANALELSCRSGRGQTVVREPVRTATLPPTSAYEDGALPRHNRQGAIAAIAWRLEAAFRHETHNKTGYIGPHCAHSS